MDNKITKRRLANTLAYDWVKILVVIVLIVFVWSLAYTIGAPRASTGQTFSIYTYGGFSSSKTPNDLADELKEEGVFSYDVLTFSNRELTSEYYSQIMMSVISIQELDVMITEDSALSQENNSSSFRDLIDGYGDIIYTVDGLISDAKRYCLDNAFVSAVNGGYELNSDVIRDYFDRRMDGDPRFRDPSSQRYLDCREEEVLRVQNVWNNAVRLEQCLQNHPELRHNYTRFTQAVALDPETYGGEEYQGQEELTYGINLGALTGGSKSITELYAISLLDDSGELIGVTADGIIISVFNFRDYQIDLQYESLSFINYFIKNYSNFLDGEFINLV